MSQIDDKIIDEYVLKMFLVWNFDSSVYLTCILRFYRVYQMAFKLRYRFMEKCVLVWPDDELFSLKYNAK